MSYPVYFIPLEINKPEFMKQAGKYGLAEQDKISLYDLLPNLTFAERVIWAITGIKKCSSFVIEPDIETGRCSKNKVLSSLESLGLSYNPPSNGYPESTVSLKNWKLDETKASLELPYRQRDIELARWFDLPPCCTQGYRAHMDKKYSALLAQFPFKDMKTEIELETYAYPVGRKDNEKFLEVADHIRKKSAENLELVVSRKDLVATIRSKLQKNSDHPSKNLFLHFCWPIHNPSCHQFKDKAEKMYNVLRDLVNKNYADSITARNILMDQQNSCF